MKERILPEKWHILSGSALKTIAVVTMLIDHLGVLLNPDRVLLFTVFGRQASLYTLMRLIGRMAFPIFAFLIVEGHRHTRSRVRYGIMLFVFALLSEIPFDLFLFNTWFHAGRQNVFFTLLLGYLGMCAYEELENRRLLQVGAILALLLTAFFLRVDYGVSGFCFIMLMYALRDRELLRDVAGIMILSSRWKAGLAFVPLAFYNGKRGFIKGPVLKYAFYLFYPLHLLALYGVRVLSL
jgi:hypothetical protein